jgi:hypothetical protein
MVFAGPVFTEWYWGPLFFAVVFGPPLVLVAILADLAVHRWVAPLRGWRRAGLWVAVLAGGPLMILGGQRVIAHLRFERDARAAARVLDFTPYAATSLPDGFSEQLVTANAYRAPVIFSHYDVGPAAYAYSYQERPADVALADGRCELHSLASTSTSFFEGPCREVRTPAGRSVYVGASHTLARGGTAFALLGGTLVRFENVGVAERDVLAYFDALEPVAPDELDFKGP